MSIMNHCHYILGTGIENLDSLHHIQFIVDGIQLFIYTKKTGVIFYEAQCSSFGVRNTWNKNLLSNAN